MPTTSGKKPSTYKGVFLASISGICIGTLLAVAKITDNVQPMQLTAYRYAGHFLFSLPEAIARREPLLGPTDMRRLLIIRGILGLLGEFFNFMAIQNLPLGEASVIVNSVPVFVTIAARIILKEPFGIVQFITVMITFLGIILTAQIPEKLSGRNVTYTTEEIHGLVASVAALLCHTFLYIVWRKLKGVHQSINMLYSGGITVPIALILTPLLGQFELHRCGFQRFTAIIIAILSFTAINCLTIATRFDQVGLVSTLNSAWEIAVSFLWQILFFQLVPDIYEIIGTFLIVISVFFLTLRKFVLSLDVDSKLFAYLKWITI